jgi:acyl-CoA thioester hydrolase
LVIDLRLRYMRGAQFGQHIIIRADLVGWENRLKINYLASDATTGERMTRGSSVQVTVGMATREMRLASPKALTGAVAKVLA